MPSNAGQTYRYDPYRNYKFRVKWDGRYVAGFSKVSALTRSSQVVTHRAGGDPATPRRMPGQTEYQSITLERGVTHDMEFELWTNKIWDYHNSARIEDVDNQDVSLKDFRKDIVLEVFNEAGQMVLAYNIFRCWPSEYRALPELDGMGNAVAIQMLTLENEGWARDTSVSPPTGPSFILPSE